MTTLNLTEAQKNAIIEILYAGQTLASAATKPGAPGPQMTSTGIIPADPRILCQCGALCERIEDPSSHRRLCSVARWYAGVEALYRLLLKGDCD